MVSISNALVLQQLTALGYADGSLVFLRFFYPSDDPRKEKDLGRKLTGKFPDLPWSKIEQYQNDGRGCYFVVNGGGDKDKDVAHGKAIFYEHDDLSKELSAGLWQQLGLPEPTFQVDTGGKSIHSYWVFDQPIGVDAWKTLQTDLLNFADGDRALKNPSRVMRLAGAFHLQADREPVQSTIVACSGQRYPFDQLRGLVPGQKTIERPRQPVAFIGQAMPLKAVLAKEHRDLIDRGAGEGERNRQGYKLVNDLIGCERWLQASGVNYEGSAEGLFEQYCDRCSPLISESERRQIWASAIKNGATPCLAVDKLTNCVTAWQRKDQAPKINTSVEKKQPSIDLNTNQQKNADVETQPKTNGHVTFEQAIERLRKILEIDSVARRKWELAELSKQAGKSVGLLLEIYDDKLREGYQFGPIDAHDFIDRKQGDRKWLVSGFLPCGSTVAWIANGGDGKSILGYDFAKAIATGKPWNGFKTIKSKVLIIQTDEPELDTQERLEIAGYRTEVERGQVAIETNWQFSQIRELERYLDKHFVEAGETTGLVIIDSFTSANRNASSEEKDASYAACLYDLRDIANRTGITFVILHHTNKSGASRGTTGIPNNVSEVWLLSKGEPKDNMRQTQRILEVTKTRTGAIGKYVIDLNPEDYSWHFEGDYGAEPSVAEPLSARILNFLDLSRGIKYELEELMSVASLGGPTKEGLRKQLERMAKRGLINRERRTTRNDNTNSTYYVYFSPIFENPCISERLVQPSETPSQQSFPGLDNSSNSTLSDRTVQPREPIQEEDLSGLDKQVEKKGNFETASEDHAENPSECTTKTEVQLKEGDRVMTPEGWEGVLKDCNSLGWRVDGSDVSYRFEADQLIKIKE